MSQSTSVASLLRRIAARMVNAGVLERVILAVAAIILALLVGSVMIFATGNNPINTISLLYEGAFGTERRTAITLRNTTLLTLAGVAVAVSFRADVFNIGVQGQLLVGGFATVVTILGLVPYVPEGGTGGVILVTIGLLAGIVAGGLYAAIPGLMLAYADANEVVTTIMLNLIATGVLFVLADGPFRGEDARRAMTDSIPEFAGFPALLFDSRNFSIIALLIVLVTVAVTAVVLSRTVFGYDLQTSGKQAAASAYSGVNPERTIVSTMVFSGMIAGLCGGVYVIMVLGRFQPGFTPDFGFTGIAVSLLGANNPIAVIPSGLLFGSLQSGQSYLDASLQSDVPRELISGIVGLIILFVATPEMFRMAGKRLGIGGDEQ